MMFLRFLSFVGGLSDAWGRLKDIYRAARSKVRTGKVPKGVVLPTGSWAQRFWSALISLMMAQEIIDFFVSLISKGMGLGFLGFMKVAPDHAADVVEFAANKIIEFEPEASRLAALTMKQITGVDIDPKEIEVIVSEEEGRTRAVDLGSQFMRIVTSIFSVDAARKDFETRTGNSGSASNLASYFGTNLFFQMRSLTIATVASLTGWHTLRHLEQLHQSVNWAFGFGWLSWSVMSEYMNVCINPGIHRSLMGQVRPNDYSEAEARWAWWAGFINTETLSRIMDNEGVRIDIRDALLNKAEADMTESTIYDLWQHGIMSESEVTQRYRVKGFGERSADFHLTEIKDRRLWNILDKIDEKYQTLYRDCVIDKIELQQWLQARGWTANEQDAAVALQELDRRSRKYLTDTELNKLLDSGLMEVSELHDYLTCQGLTELDAAYKILLLLEQKIPKDCWDKIRPEDWRGSLNALLSFLFGAGTLSFPPGMLKLAQCLGTIPIPIPGPPGPGEKAPAPKLPSGGISTLPSTVTKGDPYRLVWNIDKVDSVTIDNEIGKQPPQGTLFLTGDTNRVYHLTAENDDGVKTFQASILVKPPAEEKPGKARQPSAAFSVSPGKATEGDQIVLQWETENAEDVRLDDGSGSQIVPLSGARFSVADKSRVYTLTASGPGGQRVAVDALIVVPPAQAKANQPTGNLAITPGQQDQGKEVEIRWTSANADLVRLDGIRGGQQVRPSGAMIFTADQDRIVTLHLENVAAGLSREIQDAIIVRTPASSPTPNTPAPTVSLTIRPSKAKAGATVALEWRTTHCDRATLDIGAGPQPVDLVGGVAATFAKTQLIVLHGFGKGGDKAIAKVLVVG